MDLDFVLELTTDYHVGAGIALGTGVDSALLRDSDGVPVLRGSTLTGLLRDGLWRLLQTPALETLYFSSHRRQEQAAELEGRSMVTAWCRDTVMCPLCRIFGTPGRPKRWNVSSGRPVGASRQLRSMAWTRGEVGSQAVARVRINPRTRRAEARQLFAEETGDKRLRFAFTVSCSEQGDASLEDEAAWIVAAARMVRHFGSARRRGHGECVIHLARPDRSRDNEGTRRRLERCLAIWNGGRGFEGRRDSAPVWQPIRTATSANGGSPVRYRVWLRLDEPAMIARRAESGNMFDSLAYLNGTVLWGALARRAVDKWHFWAGSLDRECPAYKEFLRVFVRGSCRVYPLYPATLDDNALTAFPTIPSPLDLLTCKAHPGFAPRGHGVASGTAQWCEHCKAEDTEERTPLVEIGGFLPLEENPQRYSPARHGELHPRIHPRTQRAATGGLFGYALLDAGQYFSGEIWTRDDASWESLRQLAELPEPGQLFSVRIGRGNRRGHGKATLWMERLAEVDPWRCRVQSDPDRYRLQVDDEGFVSLRLTLLTDAIITDYWGRFLQTLHDTELLTQAFRGLGTPQILSASCTSGTIDGFSGHLGLPRWRDIAMKAGSGVAFRLPGPGDDAARAPWLNEIRGKLSALEADGLGLRRNEGFGQIVFNHPLYEGGRTIEGVAIRVPEYVRLEAVPSDTAKIIVDEANHLQNWRRRLERDEDLLRHFEVERSQSFEAQKWGALARWLWDHANDDADSIKDGLDGFGQARHLVDTRRFSREPKAHFQSTEARQAMECLKTMLNEVSRMPRSAQSEAMRLLADRISYLAKKGLQA